MKRLKYRNNHINSKKDRIMSRMFLNSKAHKINSNKDSKKKSRYRFLSKPLILQKGY